MFHNESYMVKFSFDDFTHDYHIFYQNVKFLTFLRSNLKVLVIGNLKKRSRWGGDTPFKHKYKYLLFPIWSYKIL